MLEQKILTFSFLMLFSLISMTPLFADTSTAMQVQENIEALALNKDDALITEASLDEDE